MFYTDLKTALDALRYKQARRAINAALQRVDLAVEEAAEPHSEPGTRASLNDRIFLVNEAHALQRIATLK